MTDVAINTPSCNRFHPNTLEILPLPKITIRQILEHVAQYYGHSPGALLGAGRTSPYPLHRWVVMHLAKQILNPSSKVIGRVMRRDHTTVLSGFREIERHMAKDPAFAAEVRRLEANIRQGLES